MKIEIRMENMDLFLRKGKKKLLNAMKRNLQFRLSNLINYLNLSISDIAIAGEDSSCSVWNRR